MEFRAFRTLSGHKGGVLCVCFSPTGAYILSGSQDRTIQLWNGETGKAVTRFETGGHGQAVRDVQCSNDSATVVSVGQDKLLLVWDVARCAVSRKIRAHEAEINCVRLSPDNSVVVTGSTDKKVHVWDMRSRSHTPIQTLGEARDGVSSVAAGKHEMLVGSLDGVVRQYDLRAGKLRSDKMGATVMGATYSNDGNCILVSTLDSKCRLLDKASGELLNEYAGHRNTQYRTQATFSSDDALVASGSEDQAVYVWDLVEARVKQVLKGHTHVVSSLAYSPVARSMVSGSIDNTLIVWKAE
jgi:mitogen-activated protein kinase organizer 1